MIQVVRQSPGGFLGCSVRARLPLDPFRLVDGQRTAAADGIPGVAPRGGLSRSGGEEGTGLVQFQIFADDTILMPGVHGRPVATRAFLPWPETMDAWGAPTRTTSTRRTPTERNAVPRPPPP